MEILQLRVGLSSLALRPVARTHGVVLVRTAWALPHGRAIAPCIGSLQVRTESLRMRVAVVQVRAEDEQSRVEDERLRVGPDW